MTDQGTAAGTGAVEVAERRDFGFVLMEQMLEKFHADREEGRAGPWERRLFAAGMLGAAVGMLGGTLLPPTVGAWVAVLGLGMELAGLGASLGLMIKREWRGFRHATRSYAEELERDFALYQRNVAQMRAFPLIERQARLRYIGDRRRVMQHRLGLMTGGMERLGVLPVIVALYFQFKDWKWGDWHMLAEINLVQGLIIWMLLLLYAAGWYLIRLHSRAEAYELLLAESCRESHG